MMFRTCLVFLLLSETAVGDTPASASTGITYGWEATGLSGGGATYMPAVSPHDPNLILLSCDMRNVFRRTTPGRMK